MVYNPATDFLGIWRNNAGQVSKVEMPGLDYVVAALARANIITLVVSATAPVVSQATTAWLQAAVPSYSAEGVLRLWNPVTSAYAAATPALFFEMLQAATGQDGVSWWTSTGGPPLNTVGNNGDFAIRTDEPGGIYGPKAAGAWPASPIAGTTDLISSVQLDLTFGNTPGLMIYRGAALWQSLGIGGANSILGSTGTAPAWGQISALLDTVFGNAQGDILYRDAALWKVLAPGVAGTVLASGGVGANPLWAPRTAEFPSGTTMIFQQTAAPPGWTKNITINDYGLRVTSGAVGVTPGTGFSTVFAQTVVGDTTLTVAQMPSHSHPTTVDARPVASTDGGNPGLVGSAVTGIRSATFSMTAQGGGLPHNHSIALALSYVDVIIASKN